MSDPVEPTHVETHEAKRLLGCKHSKFYEIAAEGGIDLVKDGAKTLVVLASIRRYQARLPKAILGNSPIKKTPARKHKRAARKTA